jgi:hypothetical protein
MRLTARSPVVVLLALMAACSAGADAPAPSGGSVGPTDAARAVDVIASALIAHPRAEFESERDASCVAQAVVSAFEIERLEQLGLDSDEQRAPELTVPPMTDAEGDLVYAAYDECLDHEARDIESFMANGLAESEARCAHERYRASDLPRTHLLLQNHDSVPHEDLHTHVEALWNDAQATCRGSV